MRWFSALRARPTPSARRCRPAPSAIWSSRSRRPTWQPGCPAVRLSGYARNRKILSGPNLGAADVDAALAALRPRVADAAHSSAAPASPTKQLVLEALSASQSPMSAAEVATATGISRATAQRYLAGLASSGEAKVGLRYGTTGRPEQEFVAVKTPRRTPPAAGR